MLKVHVMENMAMKQTRAKNLMVRNAIRDMAPDLLKAGVFAASVRVRQGRTQKLRDHTFIYVPYGTDMMTRHEILDIAIKTYEANGTAFWMNNARTDGDDYTSQYRIMVLCEEQSTPISLRTKGKAICPHCGLAFHKEGEETYAQVEGWYKNHIKIHFDHQGKLRKELLFLKKEAKYANN